jgi:hypothetical protein
MRYFVQLTAWAACAALIPQPALAQDLPPIEESAADLAFGYCPLFLADKFSLTGAELKKHGFGTDISKVVHPTHGELTTVSSRRPDGEILFGGQAGRVCTVTIAGSKHGSALAKLRTSMSFMGVNMKPVKSPASVPPVLTIESFRGAVGEQFLNLQLLTVGGPTPAVMTQMFVTGE